MQNRTCAQEGTARPNNICSAMRCQHAQAVKAGVSHLDASARAVDRSILACILLGCGCGFRASGAQKCGGEKGREEGVGGQVAKVVFEGMLVVLLGQDGERKGRKRREGGRGRGLPYAVSYQMSGAGTVPGEYQCDLSINLDFNVLPWCLKARAHRGSIVRCWLGPSGEGGE